MCRRNGNNLENNSIYNTQKKYFSTFDDVEAVLVNTTRSITKNLDLLISSTRTKLTNNEELTDKELEQLAFNLTTELYYIGTKLELFGIKEDICKSIRQKAYSIYLSNSSGTVAEKTNTAESSAFDETLIQNIYSRAYKSLKLRLELGQETLNTVKKILTRRISELELSNSKFSNKERG